MLKLLKLYPATLISLLLAVLFFLVTISFSLDIFEVIVQHLNNSENLELDELIIAVLFVLPGIGIDTFIKKYKKRQASLIAEIKLESLQTVMRTVQDIVGNTMNNLVLYCIEAKESKTLSKQSIEELETIIQSTTKKINDLASLKEIREIELGEKMFIIDANEKDSS
jgi:uncharacterized membrane protein YwzB